MTDRTVFKSHLAASGALPVYMRSGRWYAQPYSVPATGTTTNGFMYLSPLPVPIEVTLDRLAAWVQVAGNAGSLLRAGIYLDDGLGLPATLLLDAGTQVADTTNEKDWTISQVVPAGLIWLACAVQSAATTTPQVIRNSVINPVSGTDSFAAHVQGRMGLVYTGVTGALPASLTAASIATAAADVRMGVRVA